MAEVWWWCFVSNFFFGANVIELFACLSIWFVDVKRVAAEAVATARFYNVILKINGLMWSLVNIISIPKKKINFQWNINLRASIYYKSSILLAIMSKFLCTKEADADWCLRECVCKSANSQFIFTSIHLTRWWKTFGLRGAF